MVDLRAMRRAEARKRRVIESLGADQREQAKHIRIGRALDQMKLVLLDEVFLKLVSTRGIQTIPVFLSGNETIVDDRLDRTLKFVIAWRFFSPLLYDAVAGTLLEKRWPGFQNEIKDLFIALVADGPFPHELRGRDRRMM